MEIRFTAAGQLKEKPKDESSLGFGKIFTDYMFTYRYSPDKGWHDAAIEPYAPIALMPSTSALHYGQAIFEGLKAYKDASGNTRIFRARDNFARMNRSAARMCMCDLPEDELYEGLCELLKAEEKWIPTSEGTSLYIRPTLIATDPVLGVHASHDYLFFIILSPSGAYYPQGLKPVPIYVEDEYVRAVVGGVGFAKTAGNYAASILAAQLAQKKGYTQVLWLDGIERKYVEEVGAMNMMFVIDGQIITPPLLGSILPGITRDSVLKLADDMGIKAVERSISIDEVMQAGRSGALTEAFGTGTAAVISPVGELFYSGEKLIINGGRMGPVAQRMYDTLTAIQLGAAPDKHGWSVILA